LDELRDRFRESARFEQDIERVLRNIDGQYTRRSPQLLVE
jgi:hypothetical protein